MNRIYVICNPSARGEKSRRMIHFLEAQTRGQTEIVWAPTTQPNDASRLAAQAVNEGYQIIVAGGGDGTVNEVVNGIGTSGVTLGLLPLGTVNVFARELGIPLRLEHAWKVIEQGVTKPIDLGCATGNGQRRYFVQLAGVGFDAWAVQHASWELKKKVGPLSYVWAGLKAVSHPCGRVAVQCDRNGFGGEGVVVLIGNGRLYGGRFPVFPQARPDDGKLDVCVFGRGGYRDVLRYAQGVIRGVHVRFPDVHYFQTDQLECCAHTTEVPFEVDGELAGHTPVRFHVLPRALRVLAPVAETQ